MMQAATLRELGAVIKGTDFKFHDAGAYAGIFVDKNSGKVRKVFFGTDPQNLSLIQRVFDDEIAAYGIARSGSVTALHIPKFYGAVAYRGIEASDGTSLDASFMPRLVYEMEYIEGQAVKLKHSKHLAAFEQTFRSEGINYI